MNRVTLLPLLIASLKGLQASLRALAYIGLRGNSGAFFYFSAGSGRTSNQTSR